ncbi:metal ABC transporter solute-binding protein, Zn/Mn family [Mycolicibacterium komossense]|uniref:Zinc ABC transporter substrate-binding protein n=1 Tax=Mycolicibacterium komossense TaxID=1779 RepID=A0ABT3CJM5_9MYCO|nr:zinc ABC transporter substrate-binding protein [Mycolicibacterium komossense]MCV7229689.1 zinc ABC transporter substrate-binding protein [Mycolicibacterium komossense]
METIIITDVIVSIPSTRLFAAVAVAVVLPLATACSGGGGEKSGATTSAIGADAPACPAQPVKVTVSVDQWGQIAAQLGGQCATVTTVLANSSVDPHDYEPSPADAAEFTGAQLVVLNGDHYDEWAAKLAATSAPAAPVITAAALSAPPVDGAAPNPHVWYSPTTIDALADAVTKELSTLAPGAGDYFAERRAAFTSSMQPYTTLIADIRKAASAKTYAATEPVFDLMAQALGLTDKTPTGYQTASANESDPAPADLSAFRELLADKGVDVLIFNTQTEGSVPDDIRAAAEKAGVPVVNVTETVAPGAVSFEAWQVDQLTALAKALGVNT